MENYNHQFGNLKFEGAHDLKAFCKKLRLDTEPGVRIDDVDIALLLRELFSCSDKARRLIKGRKVIGWTSKTDTAGGKGLAAILDDGSVETFSVNRAIDDYIKIAESPF